MEFKRSNFFYSYTNRHTTSKIYKYIGIVKNIFKRKSQTGNLYGIIETSDAEGMIEIFVDIKDVYFIEENYEKNQIFIFNVEIKLDRNSGIRIICQSIHKLFDYLSKHIKSINLSINNKNCLQSLKDQIRNSETGNSNIAIVLNINNRDVEVILNENLKINDNFINSLSKIPFLENIILK